jgi:predicted molibdopterin-dependent oxidoreductase YjgC
MRDVAAVDLRIVEGTRRGPIVHFTFDGVALQGHRGESVAAALWAAGTRGSSSAPGYRTLFCAMGICQQCALWIDGRRVESCRIALRDGMEIRTS